ncbi:hypothetical protein AVEN_28504-1 [Araneus ventricosus]|uniref:Uncharacterized protein n=1 Tax=Araneus ventricosus TaxID=182803 RepID=A0A4Y2PBR2_ARAVE|nr:hypothetical protein AVEN_106161-1 [Araneus ventricosus]GBN48844.1 hypothetical protein AVEN_102196-1 [Araneus ventricosus]GBN69872.1 hypothetical protein AVEN_274038-1 [Araneus ventricosus]GBN69878.1 hypothetical protein AVEN_28504-1 [Araneus ventricosus]
MRNLCWCPSPSFHASLEGGHLATTYDLACGPLQDGSSLESGFEPGTLRLRRRSLITRPQVRANRLRQEVQDYLRYMTKINTKRDVLGCRGKNTPFLLYGLSI